MSEELNKRIQDQGFVRWAVQGNEDACTMLNALGFAAHLWDDLVDADQQRTAEDINRMLFNAFIGLANNPFYAAHSQAVRAVLCVSINAWQNSNVLEKRGEGDDLVRAYTLRTQYNDLIILCAYLVGGYDWMRDVARAMLDNKSLSDGTFEEYKNGL